MKPTIAVAGSKGQLGWEIQQLSGSLEHFNFIFCDREELDLTNAAKVEAFFQQHRPAFFINCAAYTAVDKAETEQEQAYKVNAEAPGVLARECAKYDTTLIGFSTDYVFDGEGKEPLVEDAATAPINYYGYTKLAGEQLALNNWQKTIILRTSWVYSSHGHNFVKTMLRLMKEREEINVVSDQVGSPTYARDLAEAVFAIVGKLLDAQFPVQNTYSIYHYSNEGVITWFDFAVAIRDLAGLDCKVNAIPSSQFPTPAKRPTYSVLDKKKIGSVFGIKLKDWKTSLQQCLEGLK
ncbi:MAG: rfbD [Chitinophagaceae bacterium]|jgi:dTDP-4-dehydrorhamnose reductase|nr:rfbD [Chitinophagaceae bacterium]